ncbi:MAG: DUF2807 domain-containing protein [Saprospiraceae bacterium]|nr:DUF2807 domain-containing protein [Saprospiraceae bacterium]MBK9686470.1 DUF2807 domain-containing protein [Saprospiraceae bacterium]
MNNLKSNSLLWSLAFCFLPWCGATQSLPLRGGAVTLQNNYPFKNFDKIEFRDLDGDIKVEIGQEWSIKVDIPENLFPLLKVEKDNAENQLLIELNENKNNRLYVEDSKIWIQITMPEASVIRSIGNQNVEIKGILGRYFRAELKGNGNIVLQGSIDELEIKHEGNGNIFAGKLQARLASVKMAGNGNIYVNSLLSLQANGRGNGNVVQLGPGAIHPLSGIVGNGEVIKK